MQKNAMLCQVLKPTIFGMHHSALLYTLSLQNKSDYTQSITKKHQSLSHVNILFQQREITKETITSQSQKLSWGTFSITSIFIASNELLMKLMTRNLVTNKLCANHETITGQSREFSLLEKAFGTVCDATERSEQRDWPFLGQCVMLWSVQRDGIFWDSV